MNALKNCVSVFIRPMAARSTALSCSIRAFCLSKCCLAFWYAGSARTSLVSSSVTMRVIRTRSLSLKAKLPHSSLNG